MLFKTSTFSLGAILTKDLIISIEDVEERKFSGFIGNKYFENYVITLDNKNKRVGFLATENIERGDTKTTFGLSYSPYENKLLVTSVYKDSEAEKKEYMWMMKLLQLTELRFLIYH